MSRSVLVTGGNRGIGLAVARALAEAGDKVAVTYRSGEPPADLFGVRCDVTDSAAVAAAVEEVAVQQGPVEVLVSNAGITRDGLLLSMAEEDFSSVIDTNLLGAVRVAQQVIPGMLKARWGRLIFISSTTGTAGAPGQTNYAASKAALIGLARSLAKELGPRNITANAVSPGIIATDMAEGVTGNRMDQLLSETSLKRVGTPEEVAAVVRFLASDGSSYVTGANVPVTGGGGVGC
ncbi:3-oxoacyl-ACP reductase FabG [Streptomyces sp. ISL-98]|uniref:3-oxoacyl-ACP reductase FabG n=1 Tax=Streptomyces sp. ISL-98 TaxID=2819192 RepID=UPI001BE66A56|nr:3-oxoacyl-ACP reductase FabG [Streptomyces sp. ISL-98]MBT2510105.1 3-oxoacyl-ACP reductase FabG [Streptomyces sp. ISL-98]